MLKTTIGELYMELRKYGRGAAVRPPQRREGTRPGRLVN
jgi:transposase